MLLTGLVGMIYVPIRIIVSGDATATAKNIVNSGLLLRIGILSNIICQVVFVFLVMTLYTGC
jgi:hypothetical protein